jgi:nucleoside-diphosphate-sugar epimerase
MDAVYSLAVLIHHSYADCLNIIEAAGRDQARRILVLDWPVSEEPVEADSWIGVTTWSKEQQADACRGSASSPSTAGPALGLSYRGSVKAPRRTEPPRTDARPPHRRPCTSSSPAFVGRHLHAALDERGDDVTAIDLIDGGRRDALDLFRTDQRPYDLAIHCAAIVGGRASIDGSPLGVATNLALDAWYMRWLARTGTPRAVYFSSSAAYPVALQQPGDIHRLVETDIDYEQPGRPDATYGLAKLAGSSSPATPKPKAAASTCSGRSPATAKTRTTVPVPRVHRRAKERQDPFEIWGDGSSTRDWIHIDDLVGATLAAVDQDATGPVNIGWGRATIVRRTRRHSSPRAAGYHPELKHLATAPQGVHHRVCDPKRMLDVYQPRVSLEEGIARALNT